MSREIPKELLKSLEELELNENTTTEDEIEAALVVAEW